MDTGPCIVEEDLQRIFEKFERAGSQAEEGSGLGWPIAKEIVELHRRRLWVKSRFGEGSRFIIRLPTGAQQSGQPEKKSAGRTRRYKRARSADDRHG